MLLNTKPGCTSFEDIKTIGDKICASYHDAAQELGLLIDDHEWDLALLEAGEFAFPQQIRELFSTILTNGNVTDPKILFENHQDKMIEDFRYTYSHKFNMKNEELENCKLIFYVQALDCIEEYLKDNIPKTYLEHNYGPLYSLYTQYKTEIEQKQIILPQIYIPPIITQEERYTRTLQEEITSLNTEQKIAFDKFEFALRHKEPLFIFIDGPAGSGKTYLYNVMIRYCEENNYKCIPTAIIALAALLLRNSNGTTHSTFHLPLDKVFKDTILDITKSSLTGKKILEANVLIIDEIQPVSYLPSSAPATLSRQYAGAPCCMPR